MSPVNVATEGREASGPSRERLQLLSFAGEHFEGVRAAADEEVK